MTQLYIDSKEVKLPDEFELELITENPYFTRVGSYTYEIDIDLRDPINRDIYRNINRTDVTQRIQNRKAVLVSGASITISGIEVILSIDCYIAKIQIVAGNSQLNYEGGDNSIRTIRFDRVSYMPEDAIETLMGTYPQYNVTYPPVLSFIDKDGNSSILNNVEVGENITFLRINNIGPQYYLLYYLENLLQKLGFTKGVNELEDNPTWCRIFVVNPYKDVSPEELLPDWTINEFIEKIEMFFKCIITIDRTNGVYNIVNMDRYFENSETIYIDDIVDDDLEKVYDTETSYSYAYDNVSYNLPSDNFYNYLKLKEGIREICTIETRDQYTDFKPDYEQYYAGPYLLTSVDFNLEYVVADYDVTGSEENVKGLKIVDRLKDAGELSSQNKTSFDIIPAEVAEISIYSTTGSRYLIGPAVKRVRSGAESQAINDLINGSTDVKGDIPDKIYIGLYYGVCEALNRGPGEYPGEYWDKMPMSSYDRYFMSTPSSASSSQSILTMPDYTLALEGENGLFNTVYKDKREIDTTVEYHFHFLVQKIFDTNGIFLIRNKKYYCKEIHYKISSKGLDKMAEGIFYLSE